MPQLGLAEAHISVAEESAEKLAEHRDAMRAEIESVEEGLRVSRTLVNHWLNPAIQKNGLVLKADTTNYCLGFCKIGDDWCVAIKRDSNPIPLKEAPYDLQRRLIGELPYLVVAVARMNALLLSADSTGLPN
jgi:hypothetical protein